MDIALPLVTSLVSPIVVLLVDRWWHKVSIQRRLSWVAGSYRVDWNSRDLDTSKESINFELIQRNVFTVRSEGGPTGNWEAQMTVREDLPSYGFGVFGYPERAAWGTHQYHLHRKCATIDVYGLNQGKQGTVEPFRLRLVRQPPEQKDRVDRNPRGSCN